MRVTHMLVARRTQNYIQDAMDRLARTQEQMSTGRKVLRLSDDPPALSQLLNVRTAVERNKQYTRNITDGLSYLDGADTALGTASELLQKAIEYAIQGANGTLEPDDMAAIGEQIDYLCRQKAGMLHRGYPDFKRRGTINNYRKYMIT